LYLSSAYAATRVAPMEGAAYGMAFWAMQIAFNTLWTPVFFGLHRIKAAFFIMIGLWAAVAGTMVSFFMLDWIAGALFVPYLIWVTVAGALNASVWAQRPLDLFALEDLDDVALADVVVVLEGHAAFLAGLDLGHLVLEALERLQRAFVDHHVVAQQAHPGGAAGDAFGHEAAGDLADAGDAEDLLDLGIADEVLANLGTQQARCAAFTSSTRS
jgi:uncharacterized membrane protein YwzB